jgi:putative endonuclease
MSHKSEIGALGEQIACEYLVKQGYRVLERNVLKPWGELDIIAKQSDGTLVFVEVKAMVGRNGELKPEDNLTRAKLQKLQKTALLYTGHHPERVKESKGWRIDLVAVTLYNNLTNSSSDCKISHYENI